jgi:hypothetical protein
LFSTCCSTTSFAVGPAIGRPEHAVSKAKVKQQKIGMARIESADFVSPAIFYPAATDLSILLRHRGAFGDERTLLPKATRNVCVNSWRSPPEDDCFPAAPHRSLIGLYRYSSFSGGLVVRCICEWQMKQRDPSRASHRCSANRRTQETPPSANFPILL